VRELEAETEILETGQLNWPELEKKVDWIDRAEVLTLASDLLTLLQRRTCAERFKEQEGDKTRVSYARVMVAAISAYGGLLRDAELDDLKRRIEALETVKGKGDKK
jgi:hypothetical protein